MTTKDNKATLTSLWHAAIKAVSGQTATAAALREDPPFAPNLIIAVGKAAAGMALGALETQSTPCETLIVTKYGHVDPSLLERPGVTIVEAAHPIPDENSLRAGELILEAVGTLSENTKLLLLVSGGASALAERLPGTIKLDDWAAMNREMVASGKTIAEINAKRKKISLLKGGKLMEAFSGNEARVYALSDVEGDDISVIGSGIGDTARARCIAQTRIIGSNRIARDAAARAAEATGLNVCYNEETLYGDVFDAAIKIAGKLQDAAPGVYIWGGEPTIRLPAECGNGGRSQSLALALAKEIFGRKDITILVAGTDGTDGPTDAAGAIVDGRTCQAHSAVDHALKTADAGSYLRSQNNIFITGPTNTNVMDIVIAIVD